MELDFVNDALKPFGAECGQLGQIIKRGKVLSAKAVLKGGRLRFESESGVLLASGRPDGAFVQQFVKRFWLW